MVTDMYFPSNDGLQTISESGGDLASLIVLIFVVLTGFSIGFNVAFGQNVQACKDIVSSLSTLLQAVLGQFDYAALRDVNKIMAPLFFVTYIAIGKITATHPRFVRNWGARKKRLSIVHIFTSAAVADILCVRGPAAKSPMLNMFAP
jgi:hypothetical protein